MVSVADVAPRTPWEEPPAMGEAIEVGEGRRDRDHSGGQELLDDPGPGVGAPRIDDE